ncbi:MAG: hypothetical protein ACE368_08435 [Paracoccaceae bacterium]
MRLTANPARASRITAPKWRDAPPHDPEGDDFFMRRRRFRRYALQRQYD